MMAQAMLDNNYGDTVCSRPADLPDHRYFRKREQSRSFDLHRYNMSNYYYPPSPSSREENEFDFDKAFSTPTSHREQTFLPYATHPVAVTSQTQMFDSLPPLFHHTDNFDQPVEFDTTQHPAWMTPIVPSNAGPQQHDIGPFPQYSETFDYTGDPITAGPSTTSAGYLSPEEAPAIPTRSSRATSFASNVSSAASAPYSDVSRSVSPSASEMAKWGYKNGNGTWKCAYPGCSSKTSFSRGCDLRKHYKRHTKSLYCRQDGCPQATEGGFSSKKDRARHEAKHNPNIVCEWEGCDRLFSRVDNMKDHVRRVHRKRLVQ